MSAPNNNDKAIGTMRYWKAHNPQQLADHDIHPPLRELLEHR